MKLITSAVTLSLFALLPVTALQAQQSSPVAKSTASAKRSDVYHVFFAKAALGKAQELAEFLKEPDPNAPNPTHLILLRHQDGDDWD